MYMLGAQRTRAPSGGWGLPARRSTRPLDELPGPRSPGGGRPSLPNWSPRANDSMNSCWLNWVLRPAL
eukprot:11003191-Lingulodinium_polyedra.AAC.1